MKLLNPIWHHHGQFYFRFALSISIFFHASCNYTNTWTQFHGSQVNDGFAGVITSSQLQTKWVFNIPYATYSSPVIGGDGTIYVGTTTGVLAAVKSDGTGYKWVFHTDDRFLSPTIVSSAAIGQQGEIYFIVCHLNPNNCDNCPGAYSSTLMKIGADATFINSFEITPAPQAASFTTTSPKILNVNGSDFIFLAAPGLVYVLDNNLHVLSQARLNCSGDLVAGNVLNFDRIVGPDNGPHFLDNYVIPDRFWVDPSIAVTNKIGENTLPGVLIAVPTNNCGLECFEWTPPPIVGITTKWYSPRSFGDCLSSPAISDKGEVVIGSASGWLFSYNLQSGKGNWILKTNEQMVPTPGFALNGSIYAVGSKNLFNVQGGVILRQFLLPAPTGSSCAISANRIITASLAGITSLAPDFSSIALDNLMFGGMSSPAIAGDGTVYVLGLGGYLAAYKNN